MEIGDQRGRGARPLRADWGGTKKFFISRELWRLEIRAVEEQRPFWELPWRPRAGLGGVFPGLQPFILGADRGFNLAES